MVRRLITFLAVIFLATSGCTGQSSAPSVSGTADPTTTVRKGKAPSGAGANTEKAEAPETPQLAAARTSVPRKLVGRWSQEGEFFNRHVPYAIEFKSDGTYVGLQKDGQPIAERSGRWEVVRIHQFINDDLMQGKIRMIGMPTEVMTFSYRGPALFDLWPPSVDEPGMFTSTMYRRKE